MSDIAALVADNIDVWTSAIERKSGAGRGGGKRISLYGIDRLRALILDLAVRGKLVLQDAGDEPASELLKRIKAADNQLGGSRKSKLSKGQIFQPDLPSVGGAPSSWLRVPLTRVYDSISVGNNKLLSSEISESGTIPVIDQGVKFVAGYTENNDLLIKIPGPVVIFGDHTKQLKYVNFDFVAGADGIKILRPILINERFFYIQLTSFNIESRGYARHFKQLNTMDFALPPLAEQQRIVAKVDELMALCDALERESAAAMAAHQALVEILLATLVNSADATDLARDWARLERHFDILFTTDASIDALKQTILDLAVRGTFSSDLTIDWEPKCLGAYVTEASAGWSPKCIETPRAGDQWAVLKVSAVTWGTFQPTENKQLPDSLEPRPSIEVRPGDFLISRANTADLVARSVVVPTDAPEKLMMSDKIIRFRFTSDIDPKYVSLFHSTTAARTYYARVAGGTSSSMKNVSQGQIRALQLPVPPLDEQRRVVAKVDALMALCDALKARLADAARTQRHLADAIHQRAAA